MTEDFALVFQIQNLPPLRSTLFAKRDLGQTSHISLVLRISQIGYMERVASIRRLQGDCGAHRSERSLDSYDLDQKIESRGDDMVQRLFLRFLCDLLEQAIEPEIHRSFSLPVSLDVLSGISSKASKTV